MALALAEGLSLGEVEGLVLDVALGLDYALMRWRAKYSSLGRAEAYVHLGAPA